MNGSLSTYSVDASDRLHLRLDDANRGLSPSRIRDRNLRFDAFLATASRHVSAVETVLVDVTKKHLEESRAHELRSECHSLQLALRTMQARLYGSSQVMRIPWRDVQAAVSRHLERLLALEASLTADLDSIPEAELLRITERLISAELHAPTRPHPHLPRRGLRGRLARYLAARADVFWDGVQGRVAPTPGANGELAD